jgi:hypothetical protein
MPAPMISLRHEDVEFKTIDGLILRGWLYPAASKGPAVIMTPGVSQMQLSLALSDFHYSSIV